jgi:methionine synthase II (cobalamin-independent)
MIAETAAKLDDSRFALSEKEAQGFFTFLEIAGRHRQQLVALKGQITGPITFCTGVVDQDGKAIFYNDQLRDAAVKMLAQKARWQTRQMRNIADRALLFFDEPALAGLGSSAFITISAEEIIASFAEVFEAVRAEGGLVGVHVCANTEWSVIFDAGIDILSYDAYTYFDKLLLYPDHLRRFLEQGGILATGIIPTDEEHIDIESAASLAAKWERQTDQLGQLGFPREAIVAQTLITPSCGIGSISETHARKVLKLTHDVSAIIRAGR